jgi:hypothetical protein
MSGEWLSYKQAGERLGVSPEAARQRAIRGRWPKRLNNEGLALVRMPEGVTSRPRRKNEHPDELPTLEAVEQADERLVAALEAHIETLKADLTLARDQLLAERQRADAAAAEVVRLSVKLAKAKAQRKKR